MIKLFNSFTAGITDLFFALMFTIYLFGLFGHSYENIMEIKYILFLLICGGYCLITAFLCFQKAVLFPDRRELPVRIPRSGTEERKDFTKPPAAVRAAGGSGTEERKGFTKPPVAVRAVDGFGAEERKSLSKPLSRSVRLFFFFVILYICFTFLSALLSEYGLEAALKGSERREGALTICIYCMITLFIARFYRPALWHHCLFSAAVLLFCAVAVFQFFGGNPFGLYPDGYNYYDKYVNYNGAFLSTMGNAGLASAFLSVAVLFCAFSAAGLWRNLASGGRKIAAAAAALSTAAAAAGAAVLLYSGVLAGILGVFFSIVLFLPTAAGFSRKKTMIWFLVLFLLMAAACCFIYFNDAFAVTDDASSYPQAICELHEMMHGNFDDSFGSGRIHIYRNVLRLVPEHLFFGGGPDTLVLRETEDFRRYDAGRNMWIETHIDSAHSEYLNILVNQGIFALAAFLGIMVCAVSFLLRQGFGISRRSHPLLSCGGQLQGCGAFLRTACGASVVSWLIQALFGISTYISAPYFWIMLGMLFCRAESDG